MSDKEDTDIYWTQHGSSQLLEDVPAGAQITSVGDLAVEGVCESCKVLIMENEEFFHDDDGIAWHKRCD